MTHTLNLSGIWQSKYTYRSSSQKGELSSGHTVRLFQAGNELVIQSEPDHTESYLLLRLTIDERILTGTWHERTAPGGHYKGATYYGAIQLVVDKTGRRLQGKWVGFTRELSVASGNWTITRA